MNKDTCCYGRIDTMIFYDFEIKYTCSDVSLQEFPSEQEPKRPVRKERIFRIPWRYCMDGILIRMTRSMLGRALSWQYVLSTRSQIKLPWMPYFFSASMWECHFVSSRPITYQRQSHTYFPDWHQSV